MAAVGLNFIIWSQWRRSDRRVPHPGAGDPGFLAGLFFFMYALPAAAIGGCRGWSRCRSPWIGSKANYAAAAITFVPSSRWWRRCSSACRSCWESGAGSSAPVFRAEPSSSQLPKPSYSSYVALILAKVYADVTFSRRATGVKASKR